MKLTTKGRYAVMAMADLAYNASSGSVSLAEISLRQNISLPYLEQIFIKLRNSKLVKSQRGALGGYLLNKPAIAFANTANTSQVKHIINMRNMILTLLFITFDEISATDLPPSFKLITRAPKSCTAPMNTVPSTTHNIAGNQPQYTAMHGPIMGAAPAIDVK